MESEQRLCFWIVGASGTGKSRFCFGLGSFYEKPQNKWWDGYKGESTVVIDDLDTDTLGHYLKRWADRYPVKGEIKNGTVNLNYKSLFVTSNYTISDLFVKSPVMIEPLERRFKTIASDLDGWEDSINEYIK